MAVRTSLHNNSKHSNSRDMLPTNIHTQVTFPATYRTFYETTEPSRLQVMLSQPHVALQAQVFTGP
jgi:hypothetical protein